VFEGCKVITVERTKSTDRAPSADIKSVRMQRGKSVVILQWNKTCSLEMRERSSVWLKFLISFN
jgi:hypothetical protein